MIFRGTSTGPVILLYIDMICNLKCPYCSIRRGLPDKWGSIMSVEKAKIIKRFIPDNSTILIVGGEPTIHKDFKEICRVFNDYEVVVFTNASKRLIDPELLGNHVEYSVTYHSVMGEKFGRDKFLENIKGVPIGKLKLMIDKNNISEKLEDAEFFKKNGYEVEFRAIDDHMGVYDLLPEELRDHSDLSQKFFVDDKEISCLKALEFDFKHWYCEPCSIKIYPDLSGMMNCVPFRMVSELRKMKFIKCKTGKCNICYLDGVKYDHS